VYRGNDVRCIQSERLSIKQKNIMADMRVSRIQIGVMRLWRTTTCV
jgi:hypothetical protein